MADIIQTIVTETGERIETPIAYDKKMGSKVIKTNLEKAKNYKRIHNTDYCIIVTIDIKETNPRRFTEVRHGILLVHPTVLIDIAKRIRNFMIDNSRLEKINAGKDSKKDRLYELFTNAVYCRDLQARMDLKSKLEELQLKDEQSLNKRKDHIKVVSIRLEIREHGQGHNARGKRWRLSITLIFFHRVRRP